MHSILRNKIASLLMITFWLGLGPSAQAHLLVQNSLEAVVGPHEINLNVEISPYEVVIAESALTDFPSREQFLLMAQKHALYLQRHIRLEADGVPLSADALGSADVTLVRGPSGHDLACYHLVYPLNQPPQKITLSQTCLAEIEPSDAIFWMRIRQEPEAKFRTIEMHRDSHVELTCDWASGSAARTAAPPSGYWIALTFLREGIHHILTGYDHLLFIGGLVLCARSLWTLVQLIAAFTLAHTITLTLSVLNFVSLDSRIVEPMISASIVVVALRNVFFTQSQGRSATWIPLTMAFGFGLFHGLGFAGGLRDALAILPGTTLALALVCFSLGIELGHQVVVLPVYAGLRCVPQEPVFLDTSIRRWGSLAIALGGLYFLVLALTG